MYRNARWEKLSESGLRETSNRQIILISLEFPILLLLVMNSVELLEIRVRKLESLLGSTK